MGGTNPAGFDRFAEIERQTVLAEARRERLAMEALAGAEDGGRDTVGDVVRARRRLFHSVVWAVVRVGRISRPAPSFERP